MPPILPTAVDRRGGWAPTASIAISPKLSGWRQSASPRLYSSSNANSVTATVMRSAPRTASSKLNAPRRSSPRRCARRSVTVTRGSRCDAG